MDFKVYLELKCVTKARGQELKYSNAVAVFKEPTIIDSNNLDYHKSKARVCISRVSTKQNTK